MKHNKKPRRERGVTQYHFPPQLKNKRSIKTGARRVFQGIGEEAGESKKKGKHMGIYETHAIDSGELAGTFLFIYLCNNASHVAK